MPKVLQRLSVFHLYAQRNHSISKSCRVGDSCPLLKKKRNSVRDFSSFHSGRKPFHFSSNVFCWMKTFFSPFFSPQTNFPKQNKYPVLTLLMTILHNSSQDETIPGQAGMVVVRRRRSTPSTAATGGGIAGETTTTTTPASASASALALALAPTAVATMATACCPFDQEVEEHGAEPCVTTTMGGGIAGGTTTTTTMTPALASASASVSAPTAAVTTKKFETRIFGSLRTRRIDVICKIEI